MKWETTKNRKKPVLTGKIGKMGNGKMGKCNKNEKNQKHLKRCRYYNNMETVQKMSEKSNN